MSRSFVSTSGLSISVFSDHFLLAMQSFMNPCFQELEVPEALRVYEGIEDLDPGQQVGGEISAHARRTVRK